MVGQRCTTIVLFSCKYQDMNRAWLIVRVFHFGSNCVNAGWSLVMIDTIICWHALGTGTAENKLMIGIVCRARTAYRDSWPELTGSKDLPDCRWLCVSGWAEWVRVAPQISVYHICRENGSRLPSVSHSSPWKTCCVTRSWVIWRLWSSEVLHTSVQPMVSIGMEVWEWSVWIRTHVSSEVSEESNKIKIVNIVDIWHNNRAL